MPVSELKLLISEKRQAELELDRGLVAAGLRAVPAWPPRAEVVPALPDQPVVARRPGQEVPGAAPGRPPAGGRVVVAVEGVLAQDPVQAIVAGALSVADSRVAVADDNVRTRPRVQDVVPAADRLARARVAVADHQIVAVHGVDGVARAAASLPG